MQPRLLESEDHWVTHMGAWFPGKRVVFRGHDLHIDLADMDWMALYLYGITGRKFTESQLKVLNAIWTSTSFPDPRLWNNRVSALAGTARSTGALAIGASIAVSEAGIYGLRPLIRAIDFLLRASKAVTSGIQLSEVIQEEINSGHYIYGYGRPITLLDERIPYMIKIMERYGMSMGRHVRLAFEVEKFLLTYRNNLHINAAAVYAALAADLMMNPREFYLFMVPCFMAGMLPCLMDTSLKSEGSFLPLRCERILYEGIARRTWD